MRTRSPLNRVKPVIRDLFEESISVTGFAGCGGADLGIEAATGKKTDIAINHDATAIAVFSDNWPETECYRADIFSVDPVRACRGRHVRHLHASPDCRDFSRAKGAAPRSVSVRALADVVPQWARAVRPDVITLENVPEFVEWGPLDDDGKRIAARKGEFFEAWKSELTRLGYVVEHRVLHAHHFGAPTSRKRFYLVARCDGQPVRWPAATHGPGLKPYRTAAECIDWSLPCPSIFERKRPLAAATLKRCATGIFRFVINNPRPFVVTIDNGSARGTPRGVDEPLSTVIASNQRHVVVAPTLVQTSYGERDGQAPRVLDLHKPLTTVVAGGQKHGLETALAPFVAGCGGRAAQTPPTAGDAPLGTITTKNDRVVVAPVLGVLRNNCDAQGLDEPTPTVCAGGNHLAEVQALLAPFIAKHYGGVVGHGVDRPLGTVTTVDHHSLVTVKLAPAGFAEKYPNARAVLPFLLTYYGSEFDLGQELSEPLRTITTRDRFALIVLVVDGAEYAIVDIGLRMLEPHELLKAQFGEHAKGFKLDKALTKKDQVRLIGNSVVPAVMEAIYRANLPETARPARSRRPRASAPRRAA